MPVDDATAAACSDLGNAEAMARQFGDSARYIPAWNQWLVWDTAAGVWREHASVARLAHQTILTLFGGAEEWVSTTEGELERARIARLPDAIVAATTRHRRAMKYHSWLVRSQNAERTVGMLRQAAALPAFETTHDALDAHPLLLATATGTVDLTTGKVAPGQQRDLLTRWTPIAYDPSAPAPLWDAFVRQCMCGDEELVGYLQRIAGYCLTGSTEEAFLGFFHGEGANGKSTFLALLSAAMGEYACAGPRGLLFWTRNDRHPTELAALWKRRLVVCSEVEDGARLDEAKVKDLTGGDVISARRMREDFWDFRPTHKLIVAGNHWPFIRGTDEGIWRRIHPVSWNLRLAPEEIDTQITAKLMAELPGILRWCVAGAVAWRKLGLAEPEACRRLRDQYRADSDTTGLFWADAVTVHPDGRIAGDDLYAAYIGWLAERDHAVACPRRKFSKFVRAQGAVQGTVRTGGTTTSGWHGIRLATAEERAHRRWGV